MDILNEVYLGKPAEFKKVEKMLDDIIEEIKYGDGSVDINKMPQVKVIEDIFVKVFDLKSFDLTFYIPFGVHRPYNNAFTYPTVVPIFNRNKEYMYGVNTSKYSLNCHIDQAIFKNTTITSGEILGIILHEIGHNMDASIFYLLSNIDINIAGYISGENDLVDILSNSAFNNLLKAFIGITGGGKIIAKGHTAIDKMISLLMSKFPSFKNMWLKTHPQYNDACYNILSLFRIRRIFNIFKSPYNIAILFNPANIFGYGNEKFADSFATSHGYGVELSSGLNKLAKSEGFFVDNISQKSSLAAIPFDLVNCIMSIACMPFSQHPPTPVRIKSQLNKLKRDLNDPNLTPKLRKELLEQIQSMERFIEDYKDITIDENKRRIVLAFNNKMVMDFLGYADYRELLQFIRHREM